MIATAACDVIDPKLYQGAGVAAGRVADRCDQQTPTIAPSAAAFMLDTSGLAADYRDFGACVGQELPGNEGFVRVAMAAGEKWHVHVSPVGAGLDPAIYVLPSCDERACRARAARDECGVDKPEHLSFAPATSGIYLIGLDSRAAGGGLYSVVVVRPVCGNGGPPEHSESCDDGNLEPGDGCDQLCRRELDARGLETEPNDDPLDANVIVANPPGPPASASTAPPARMVLGRLGGRCDVDVFALDVPEGGAIEVQARGSGGSCAAGSELRLALVARDAEVELGVGTPAAGQSCPAIDARHAFARGLPGGTYYLRTSSNEAAPFDYQLQVGP